MLASSLKLSKAEVSSREISCVGWIPLRLGFIICQDGGGKVSLRSHLAFIFWAELR